MPIAVYRIDERLLHGQVVVGWGRRFGIGFYVVVDDRIAETAWERDLYESALPAGVESFFLTVEDELTGPANMSDTHKEWYGTIGKVFREKLSGLNPKQITAKIANVAKAVQECRERTIDAYIERESG